METVLNDNVYQDIKLKPLHKSKIFMPDKILIIGNDNQNKKLVMYLTNLLKAKFHTSNTYLTSRYNINWNELGITDIYPNFSPILVQRCFRKNWYLFIDSYNYTSYLMDILEKEIMKITHSCIVVCENPEIKLVSFLETDIKFDYIFFTSYHESYNKLIDTGLHPKDLDELIKTIEESNKLSENYHLVYDCKNKEFMYFDIW